MKMNGGARSEGCGAEAEAKLGHGSPAVTPFLGSFQPLRRPDLNYSESSL